MTLLHFDGFDTYAAGVNDLGNEYAYASSGNQGVNTTAGRFGGGAVVIATGAAHWYRKQISAQTDVWQGFAMKDGTANNCPLCTFSSASGMEVGVDFNNVTGVFTVGRVDGASFGNLSTVLGTSAAQTGMSNWNWIEFRAVLSATVGVLELWLNGIRIINVTGANTTRTGATTYTEAWLGCRNGNSGASSGLRYGDDWYIGTSRLGDSRVYTLLPNSDATPQQATDTQPLGWSPSDSSTSLIITNNNLDVAPGPGSNGVNIQWARGVNARSTGKWLLEFQVTAGGSNPGLYLGVTGTSGITSLSTNPVDSAYLQLSTLAAAGGTQVGTGMATIVNADYRNAVTNGDKYQIAVDLDAGKIWFAKNGTWNGTGNPATGANPNITFAGGTKTLYPSAGFNTSITVGILAHWNTTPTMTLPSGFSAWTNNTEHFVKVDEATPNIVDYVELDAATPDLKELYGLTDIPAVTAIYSVKSSAYAFKGDAAEALFASIIKSGSTEAAGATAAAIYNANGKASVMSDVDPATGAAWTQSGVNALTAGVKTVVT